MKNFSAIKELLDNSTTFYLISVKMDSRYGYLNGHYKKIFEAQHGDLINQHYAITMHQEDMAICSEVSAQCFANPQQIFPATIRKHDGKGGYIATQWDYKAMFDQQGHPAGVFCIGYDITAFMLSSAALEQMEHIQSHVIRKPIANLLGLTELLHDHSLPLETQNIIEMIRTGVSELDEFIKPSKQKPFL
ncbi:hypothetical protein FA048_06510 [Pedobacter polaris]|uniref:PAS fold-4 domain-containing protein n=1 Tax=Pedobacter polaris TaxID=2571273 RepID=A0A4U1CP85_9SPHI|nr:PAS domain-containing protein [Pedobacter polaris]TKC09861.1 hypothetical protein FA048_06510 [Pedobacter polaris]